MKKALYLVAMILLAVSCRQRETKEKDNEVPEVRTPEVTAESPDAPQLPWITVVDPKTGKMHLKANPLPKRGLSAQQVVEAANIRYPKLRLELVNIKQDTAYVRIRDAKYLTQLIGTAGAQAYMAEVTYSLTQLKGIKAVHFDFPEGDHASPGNYTRESFAGFN